MNKNVFYSAFFSLLSIMSLSSFGPGDGVNSGAVGSTDEYRVKLVLLEKILLYIDWPKSARVFQEDKPFYFGIYNDVQPFGEALVTMKNERKLKWKTVEVRFFEALEDFDVQYPDLLFVPREKSKELKSIASALEGRPILIIGEEESSIEDGALLAIYLKDDKIKFRVNKEALLGKGFKLNDALLQLAER